MGVLVAGVVLVVALGVALAWRRSESPLMRRRVNAGSDRYFAQRVGAAGPADAGGAWAWDDRSDTPDDGGGDDGDAAGDGGGDGGGE